MTPSTAPTTPTFMRIALPGSPHFGRSGVVLPPRGDVDRGWAEPDADGMVKVMFENLETVSVPPNCLQPVRSVSEAVTTVQRDREEENRRLNYTMERRDRSYVWKHGSLFSNGLSTGFENADRIHEAWGSLNDLADAAVIKKSTDSDTSSRRSDSFRPYGNRSARSDRSGGRSDRSI